MIESRDLENRFYVFLQTGEREFAAILFDLLHRLDEDSKAGAIDVADIFHIDDEITRFCFNGGVERGGDAR